MIAVPAETAQRTERTRPLRWLRDNYWAILLALYCLGFAWYGESRYATLNPDLSRVTIRPNVPWHYPLLAVHTAAGAVAVSLAWLQVWPWLRERHPTFHRRVGWTYLLAGVLPAGLAAYPIAVLTTSGQPTRVVLFVIAVLWSITAVAGLRAAIGHRFADHRKWMLRNVALTTTIITSRPLAMLFIYWTFKLLPGTYKNQADLVYVIMPATGIWTALVIHLIFVEWYLLRPRRRAPRVPTRSSAERLAEATLVGD